MRLQTARNPKLEVFDSKDVSNIAREWDFISFEQKQFAHGPELTE